MKKRIFEAITAPFIDWCKKANVVSVNLAERILPILKVKTKHTDLIFYCPNDMTLWRAKTLLSKEPDTIAWVDSFEKDDVLYDVGANVGMYSLYGGILGFKVYSFEPESQNYATFCRNIYLNKLLEKINAYNFAIGDENKIGHLYIKQFTIGGALNNFGENLDYKKQKFNPGFKQGVGCFNLDTLIQQYHLPIPNHIKIDVDGLERLIINGANWLLQQSVLKSILIGILRFQRIWRFLKF